MIGWWSHFDDLRVASVRLRGELVIRALRAQGLQAAWFDPQRADAFDVLVIGKRHDRATLETAARLQARGGRVLVDLCDNRFEYPANDLELQRQAQQLKELLARADHVVVSTHELSRVLQQECPQLQRVSVIGDLADDLSVVPVPAIQRLRSAVRLRRSLSNIRRLRAQGHVMLVWFGSHGGAYAESGMNDLLRVRDLLERCHRQTPLALTVISNHRKKYLQHIEPFAVPTRYEEWHAATFDRLLQAHDISLIPISDNAFTRCKTDNRIVTSLLKGLAVVADEIPSYRPYAGAIAFNRWEEQLPLYLSNPARRQADVAAGQVIAKQLTDAVEISRQWLAVFEAVGTKPVS